MKWRPYELLGNQAKADPTCSQYLNSRHSALFTKGELLYGLAAGLAAQQNTRRPVVLEGPIDVLALASRCRREGRDMLPAAACGTAFTTCHARTLARVAAGEPIVVCLDSDIAGRDAALHAGQQLRGAGAKVRIAALPTGLDPADYLTQPASNLDTFTSTHALPLLTVSVEDAIAARGDRMQWIEGRLAAARVIARDLATYPVGHAAAQIGWIASILDLDAATFTRELAEAFRSSRAVDLAESHAPRRPAFGPSRGAAAWRPTPET